MRPYETMVIFDADLDEENIRSIVEGQRNALKAAGAELGTADYWGKRRFAYRMKHKWEGFYVVLQFKAEPTAVSELDRTLSLADEVIRHKILRIPDAVYGPAKVPARAAAAAEEER